MRTHRHRDGASARVCDTMEGKKAALLRAPAVLDLLPLKKRVTGRQIFQVLKEKHGRGFENFLEEKVCPLAGDITYENLGLDIAKLRELSKDIDIIVNGAATTNFYERYDVAFDVNVLGAKHICAFAKNCTKLKMLLHVQLVRRNRTILYALWCRTILNADK